jgi:[ribosomal protein S18]-alanine N-acetyltransferase
MTEPTQTEPTQRDYRPVSDSDSNSEDWRAMHTLDLVCFTPPFRFTARAMRRFAETPHAITLLAESGGQLAAFAITHIERRTAYIVTLDVAPVWRRQGLARRLMQESETRAHAAGAHDIALHVFPGNHAALQLYESLGYRRTGLAPNFYAPAHDALIYSKPLTPAPEAAPPR